MSKLADTIHRMTTSLHELEQAQHMVEQAVSPTPDSVLEQTARDLLFDTQSVDMQQMMTLMDSISTLAAVRARSMRRVARQIDEVTVA